MTEKKYYINKARKHYALNNETKRALKIRFDEYFKPYVITKGQREYITRENTYIEK